MKLLGFLKQSAHDGNFGVFALALASLVLPVCLAIALSNMLAFEIESTRVLGYARDALRRNEQTSEQVAQGIEELYREAGQNPCSEANLTLMQRIDVGSSNLQAIGAIANNTMICSSIGRHPGGWNLGLPDFTTRLGYQVRQAVTLPFAPERKFAAIARDGFVVILHNDLPIDVAIDEADSALGIFTGNDRRLLMSRGPLQEKWAKELKEGLEAKFVRDGYLIAVTLSAKWSSGSMAALPVKYLEERAHDFLVLLIPTGVVTGLALAAVVLLLAKRQRSLVSLLKRGLRRGEFFIVYLPTVDLDKGHCVGAEVLLRWRRPTGEMVPPDIFIKIAEENALIEQVTEHVLKLLRQEAGKVFELRPDFQLAVNVSAGDLHANRLRLQIQHLIQYLEIEPAQLVLEVTERGILNADVARHHLRELQELGVHLAIDDFGTGYSSLAYLETFNLDGLKIDKSFVDKIGTDSVASGVVGHIIEMAKELQLTMVAEGVETNSQAQYLRAHGVQFAQGWLFSKPLSLDDLQKFLQPASQD